MIFIIFLIVCLLEVGVSQKEDCGKFPTDAYLANRIVGGEPAAEGEVPWMASIQSEGRHRCGGSLISPQFVLTAAHCLRGFDPQDLKVVLGTNNVETSGATVQSFSVKRFIEHGSYQPSTGNRFPANDIGIIEIIGSAVLNKQVWTICLPGTSLKTSSGERATVSGFGTNGFGGSYSNTLMKVSLQIHDNEDCVQIFPGKGIIETHLCAGELGGGRDACQGDSGGPLYVFESETQKWTLIGVVSAGEKCAIRGKLGIYTRVSEYLDWIKSNVVAPSTSKNPISGSDSVTQTPPETKEAENRNMSPCVRCICEASSNCTAGTTPTMRQAGLFGMFTMEKGYWSDGGSPRTPGGESGTDEAFLQCADNEECSLKAVRTYLTRYKRDCTGDSVINCDDFARLHRKGPGGCKNEIENTDYWSRYENCKSRKRGSDFTNF